MPGKVLGQWDKYTYVEMYFWLCSLQFLLSWLENFMLIQFKSMKY